MRYENIERFYLTSEETTLLHKAKDLLKRCQYVADNNTTCDLLFETADNIEGFLADYVIVEDKEGEEK